MTDDNMIEVANLTKRYAGKTAVADISFAVGRGEIVALLGPNGAGKSTTMRILSCFMAATSGVARVAGLDVSTRADEVRRKIGYMPENNPLHLDMRVREYLKFRACLKGSRASSPNAAWPRPPAASSASFPKASASASGWPTPWCMIPNWLYLTSPPSVWTPARSAPCAR